MSFDEIYGPNSLNIHVEDCLDKKKNKYNSRNLF